MPRSPPPPAQGPEGKLYGKLYEAVREHGVKVGEHVVDAVVGLSDLLREEHTPGLVSAGLVILLFFALVVFGFKAWKRRAALTALRSALAPTADPAELHDNITEVNRRVKAISKKRLGNPRTIVATAWEEYGETFIPHAVDGQTVLCNSVRPSQFFNLEDLHFGPGFWRVVPGLFVTAGLFLTFLGLISALHAMNTEEGVSQTAMSNLLAVASAKFIMSLTGLFCSIVFTIALRVGMGWVEQAIHSLNRVIEERLSFLSLENLAVEQVEATREQQEHFRRIGLEMVEELGRPLREELPRTISESIGNVVSPLIKQVGELGTASVGEMVRDLSSRITTDVDSSLGRASEQLTVAGDRLGTLVDRMDSSSRRMGSNMEGASEQLTQAVEELRATMTAGANATSGAFSAGVEAILSAMRETLEGIRSNTAEGSRAMGEAAAEMRMAAERLREELSAAAEDGAAAARERMEQTGSEVAAVIGGAGERVQAAIEGTAQRIAAITGEMTEKASEDLLGPIAAIGRQLDELVGALGTGANEMRRASEGVKAGANAASEASGRFRTAAGALAAAGDEVKPSVERLETATRNLAASTRAVGDSTRKNTESAAQVLEAAREALGGQRRAIEATLAALGEALARAKGQGDRLDDMDEKLGRAFERYREEVATAVDGLFGHVKEMQAKLAPALDTMREIVERAESFVPESEGRT